MKILYTLSCIPLLFLFSCTVSHDIVDLSLENNIYSHSGKPYSGKAIKYNEEGEKVAEYQFQEGIKAGPFKEWHPNGKLHRSGTIYQGFTGKEGTQYDGILTVYNAEGEQIFQETYKKGFLIPEFEVFESPNEGKLWMDRNSTSAAPLNGVSDKISFGFYYYKTGDQDKLGMDSKESNSNSPTWKRSNKLTTGDLPSLITPCPPGYRLPYPGEMEEEIPVEESNKIEAALSSGLTLPAAGKWNLSEKQPEEEGESGNYWVKSKEGYQIFYFDEANTSYKNPQASYAYSVRCLFDPSEAVEFEHLKREIIQYASSKTLALQNDRQNGKIVVRLCLDKNGIVVFRKINEEKTTIQKESLQNIALSIIDEHVFAPDPTAAKVECGNYTFKISF